MVRRRPATLAGFFVYVTFNSSQPARRPRNVDLHLTCTCTCTCTCTWTWTNPYTFDLTFDL